MAKRPASVFEALGGGAKSARPAAPCWRTCERSGGVYLFRDDPASKPSARVAAFDMDGTLVLHQGTFATHAGDWRALNDRVFPVLRQLHSVGYRLVIFSNQGGIKTALTGKRVATVKGYFDAFASALGVPLLAFAAPQDDAFKKGRPGMWNALVQHHQGGIEPLLQHCFFVGDAAGRPGDFSDSDRSFAAAAQLRFYLPEQAFGASLPPWEPFPTDDAVEVPGGEGAAAAEAAAAEAAPPTADAEDDDEVVIVE